MAASAEPARLPHLEHERRSTVRRSLPARSSVDLKPGRGGVARDLGEGGLSLFGDSGLSVGCETYLRVLLPSSDALIEASGVITWRDELATGIRFVQLTPESIPTLQNWLESSIAPEPAESYAQTSTDEVLAAKVACLREISDLQAQIASQDLDKDAAVALIIRRLAELTRATGAAIALREGEHVVCRASYGNAPDVGVQLSQSSLSGECLRSGNVILLHDSETDPRVDAEICRQLNFRSLLIVPVVSEGKAAGIAEVLSPNPGSFEGGDVLTVSFLADLIAGIAVPAEERQSPPPFDARAFEQLRAAAELPEVPEPQIAFEVPRPTAVRTQGATGKLPNPLPVVARDPSDAPVFDMAASLTATSASAAAARVVASARAPEIEQRKISITAEPDEARRNRVALMVLAVVLVLAIATFAFLRTRKAVSVPPAAPAVSTTASPAPQSAAPAVVAPVAEPPKPEPKKSDSAAARSPKTVVVSRNESEPEVVVHDLSNHASAPESAPEAPALGQLQTRSSADLAAQIVAVKTPAPELTPVQSQGVIEGKLIKKVLPHYPEMARRAGVGGDVIMSATIGLDGKLKNITVISGSPLLREEAINAARQWRYSPYLLGGKPVETETHITISFHH